MTQETGSCKRAAVSRVILQRMRRSSPNADSPEWCASLLLIPYSSIASNAPHCVRISGNNRICSERRTLDPGMVQPSLQTPAIWRFRSGTAPPQLASHTHTRYYSKHGYSLQARRVGLRALADPCRIMKSEFRAFFSLFVRLALLQIASFELLFGQF